jgi:hypothetical protein
MVTVEVTMEFLGCWQQLREVEGATRRDGLGATGAKTNDLTVRGAFSSPNFSKHQITTTSRCTHGHILPRIHAAGTVF